MRSTNPKTKLSLASYKTLISEAHLKGIVDPSKVFHLLFKKYTEEGYQSFIYSTRTHVDFLTGVNEKLTYPKLLEHLNSYLATHRFNCEGDFYALWSALFSFYGAPTESLKNLRLITQHQNYKSVAGSKEKQNQISDSFSTLGKPLNTPPLSEKNIKHFLECLESSLLVEDWKRLSASNLITANSAKIIEIINSILSQRTSSNKALLPIILAILQKIEHTQAIQVKVEHEIIQAMLSDNLSVYCPKIECLSKTSSQFKKQYLQLTSVKCEELLPNCDWSDANFHTSISYLYFSVGHPDLNENAVHWALAQFNQFAADNSGKFRVFLKALTECTPPSLQMDVFKKVVEIFHHQHPHYTYLTDYFKNISLSTATNFVKTASKADLFDGTNNTKPITFQFTQEEYTATKARKEFITYVVNNIEPTREQVQILRLMDLSDYPSADIIKLILPVLPRNGEALYVLDKLTTIGEDQQYAILRQFRNCLNELEMPAIRALSNLFPKLTVANKIFWLTVLEQHLAKKPDVRYQALYAYSRNQFLQYVPSYVETLPNIAGQLLDLELDKVRDFFKAPEKLNFATLSNYYLQLPQSQQAEILEHALLYAIKLGHLELFENIYSLNPSIININKIFTNEDGTLTTFLLTAVENQHANLTHSLIFKGADSDLLDPLAAAVELEDLVIVKILLADILKVREAFHDACIKGNIPIMQAFLTAGIDINRLNHQNESALLHLVKKTVNQYLPAAASWLLDHGAKADSSAEYLIREAVIISASFNAIFAKASSATKNALVETLLARAELTSSGAAKLNLLHEHGVEILAFPLRALITSDKLTRKFCERMQDPDAGTLFANYESNFLMQLFDCPIQSNLTRLVQVLNCFGRGLDHRFNGSTVLHHASCPRVGSSKTYHNAIATTVYLLQHGASLFIKDDKQQTPKEKLTHYISVYPEYRRLISEWLSQTEVYRQQQLFSLQVLTMAIEIYILRNTQNAAHLGRVPMDIISYILEFVAASYAAAIKEKSLLKNPVFVSNQITSIFASAKKVLNARVKVQELNPPTLKNS